MDGNVYETPERWRVMDWWIILHIVIALTNGSDVEGKMRMGPYPTQSACEAALTEEIKQKGAVCALVE